MAVMKKIVERRKDKRFQAEDGAAAVFRRPWPRSTRLGQIIDISKGGLAFRYIAGEEQSHGSSELEILWGDCSVRLDKMPFGTISDFETATEVPLNSIEMRRSSVQFGELTSEQMSQLEYFIRNHTTGEV
jgi:hypothetical protein